MHDILVWRSSHPYHSNCCRFYTTDFDEMEELFSLELNPNLPMD